MRPDNKQMISFFQSLYNQLYRLRLTLVGTQTPQEADETWTTHSNALIQSELRYALHVRIIEPPTGDE